MKNQMVAASAAVALMMGGAAQAAASPYYDEPEMQRITYSVSLVSGTPGKTMIWFNNGFGMDWDMTDATHWTKSVTVRVGTPANVYFHYKSKGSKNPPNYACSISINGEPPVISVSSGATQCLQSYSGQVSHQ